MTAARPDLTRFVINGHGGDRIDSTDADSPIRMGPNPMLFGDTDTDLTYSKPPYMRAGEILSAPPRDAGTLDLIDFVLLGESHQHLLELVERLAAATDPNRGEVLIEAHRPDGSVRAKQVRRSQSIRPDLGEYNQQEAAFTTAFRSQHPYWADLVPETVTIEFPVTGSGNAASVWNENKAWNTNEPWNGWAATAAGGSTVIEYNLRASAPSWPRWVLSGTATGLTLVNMTAENAPLVWVGTKTAGDIEIETRERSQYVRYDGTESRLGEIQRGSRMWPLVPGVNLIGVQVAGADTDTGLTMTVAAQHRTC